MRTVKRLHLILIMMLLTTATAWGQGVDYIDANGTLKNTATDGIDGNDTPTVLTGGGATTLAGGWYVVNSNITYTGTVTLNGDVHIILADGCTMNVGTSESRIAGMCIKGTGTATLTVTSQSLSPSMGDLSIYSLLIAIRASDLTINGGYITADTDGDKCNALDAFHGDLTINGGIIDATATGSDAVGIYAYDNVTINGGNVTASGTAAGIKAGSGYDYITLGWTSPADRIYASSYSGRVSVATTDGHKLYNGSSFLGGGDVSTDDVNGKTLQPALSTTYIDADGNTADATDAIVLTPDQTDLAAGTYVVNSNITYTGTVTLDGCITLILCDGYTMNVGTSESRIAGRGIDCNFLEIYGQTNGTGALSVYSTGDAISTAYLGIYGGNITANTNGDNAYAIVIGNSSLTIRCNSVTATATGSDAVGIYAFGNVTIKGGNVTVTGTAAGIQAASGSGTITLGWTNATDRITTNSYSGTVSVATTDGHKLHNGSSFLGGNVSDLADVNSKTLRPALSTTYIDDDGSLHDAVDAIVLDPDQTDLAAGTYAAYGNTHYNSGITLGGDATLILADGCHMRMGSSSDEGRIDGIGISGSANLTITSESLGDHMGALSVYTIGEYKHGIKAGALTINSGHVTADCHGFCAIALCAATGDVTINGGTVSAFSTLGVQAHAIYAQGNFNYNGGDVTLHGAGNDSYTIKANGRHYIFNWRNPDYDQITLTIFNQSNGLYAPAGATATFSKAMTDGTTVYSGTLTGSELNTLADVTLQPCAAVTFAKEGYATYYDSQYDATLPAGVKARVITADAGGTLTYQTIADGDMSEAVPAGTAVMLQTAASDAAQTMPLLLSGSSEPYIGTNLLHGSDTETATTGEGKHYKLSYNSGGTDIGWYWGADGGAAFESGAHKAWLVLPSAGARDFVGLPDWETGISRPTPDPSLNGGEWYDLQGRKLSGKPAKAGLYIYNSKKVVIK